MLHPHPESGESSPPAPHPAARAAPRAESPAQKPASDGAGLVLGKTCPLHLNSPSASRTQGSPATWAQAQPFLRSFPACPRPHAQPAAQKAQGARRHPRGVPRSPLLAEPRSGLSMTEMRVLLAGGPRVRSPPPGSGCLCRASYALPHALSLSASLCPPPRLRSAPRSPRPRSRPFLPRSGLQQNRAARGPKSGKESAFPHRAASWPTPPPPSRPSQSQLQLFPFVSVPQGCA